MEGKPEERAAAENSRGVRAPGLDLIRGLALLFVIFMHAFMNSGFYNARADSVPMLMLLLLRLTSASCVPLFLMLSGWLCSDRRLCGRYYLSVVRVLFIYAVCSVLCLLFDRFCMHKDMGLYSALSAMINFETTDYCWYVLMYLGLFLLMPFLNIVYSSLESRNAKRALLLTMFLLSVAPSLFNIRLHIYPLWWTRLYPLCYYFAGAYIREYGEGFGKKRCAAAFFALLAAAAVCFALRNGGSMVPLSYRTYDCIETFLLSTALFAWLSQVKKPAGAKLLARVSSLSFAAYLLSYIPDSLLSGLLNRPCGTVAAGLISFVLSLLLSAVVTGLSMPVVRRIKTGLEKLII